MDASIADVRVQAKHGLPAHKGKIADRDGKARKDVKAAEEANGHHARVAVAGFHAGAISGQVLDAYHAAAKAEGRTADEYALARINFKKTARVANPMVAGAKDGGLPGATVNDQAAVTMLLEEIAEGKTESDKYAPHIAALMAARPGFIPAVAAKLDETTQAVDARVAKKAHDFPKIAVWLQTEVKAFETKLEEAKDTAKKLTTPKAQAQAAYLSLQIANEEKNLINAITKGDRAAIKKCIERLTDLAGQLKAVTDEPLPDAGTTGKTGAPAAAGTVTGAADAAKAEEALPAVSKDVQDMLDAADKIDFASTDLVEQKKVMEFLSQYQRLLNEIRAGFFDAMQNLHQKVVDTLKADAKVETKLQEKKRTYAKQALALQARLMSAAATIAKLPPTAKAAAADLLLKVVGQFESLTSAISSLSANTAGVVDTTEIDSVVKELDVQMGDLEKKVADSERKAKAAGYQSAVKAADFALKASDATMVTLNTNLSALKTALGTEKDADKLSLIKAKIALLEHLTNRYKDWQTQVKALVDGLKAPTADNLGARTAALTAVTEALTNYSTAINSKNITGVTSATSFVGTATIGTGMVKALGPVLLSAAKAVDEAMAAYDRASDTTVRDQWNRYLTPDGQQRLANGERLYKENFQSPAMWDQFVDMSQYEGFEQIVPTSGITAANLKQLSDKYEQIVVKLFSQLFDNLPENSGFFKDFFKMMSTGTVTRKGLNALFKEYNVTVNGEVVEIKTDAAFNALMGITISNDTKKFGVIDIFNGLLSLAMTLNKEGWQGADGELGQARVSFHKLTKGHSFYVVDAPKMGTGLFKGLKSLLISKYGAKESDLQDDDAIFKMAMDKLLGDDSPLHPSFKKILSAVKEAGKGKDALVRLFVRVVNSNYVNPHQNDVYSKEGYEHRLDQEHFYLAIGADGDKGEHATDCLNTWISHFIVTGKFNPKAVIEGRLPEAADVPRVEK